MHRLIIFNTQWKRTFLIANSHHGTEEWLLLLSVFLSLWDFTYNQITTFPLKLNPLFRLLWKITGVSAGIRTGYNSKVWFWWDWCKVKFKLGVRTAVNLKFDGSGYSCKQILKLLFWFSCCSLLNVNSKLLLCHEYSSSQTATWLKALSEGISFPLHLTSPLQPSVAADARPGLH